MPINYSKLRGLTTREIESALFRDGFKLRKSGGPHRRYVHPDGRRVTVTHQNPGGTFPTKTLKDMIEVQARWNEANLRQLGLTP